MSTTETKTEATPMDTKIEQVCDNISDFCDPVGYSQKPEVQEPNPKGEDSESDNDSEDEKYFIEFSGSDPKSRCSGDPKRCWVCRKKWSHQVVQSEEAEKSCVKCDKKKREKGWCDGCGNHKLNKAQLEAEDTLCLACWKRILSRNLNTPEEAELAMVYWKPMIQRAAAGVPVWYQGVWL